MSSTQYYWCAKHPTPPPGNLVNFWSISRDFSVIVRQHGSLQGLGADYGHDAKIRHQKLYVIVSMHPRPSDSFSHLLCGILQMPVLAHRVMQAQIPSHNTLVQYPPTISSYNTLVYCPVNLSLIACLLFVCSHSQRVDKPVYRQPLCASPTLQHHCQQLMLPSRRLPFR